MIERRDHHLLTAIAFCVLVCLGGPLHAAEQPAGADLIVVGEDEPWMAAIAAPLAGRLRQAGRPPLVIAVAYPPSNRANWLIRRAAPKRSVVLTAAEGSPLGPVLPTLAAEIVPLGIDPVYGSLAVAKRFWQKTRQAVVASADDMEAILLGASLAESLGAPLLIRERDENRKSVFAALRDLGVEEIHLAVRDPQQVPHWAGKGDFRVEVVSTRAIQDALVTKLRAENIRTLILARVPDNTAGVGATGWLAPYVGLARGAPLVLVRGVGAVAAETEVAEFIKRYQLRPRTVTILADYASIGSELVEFDAGAEEPVAAEVDDGGTVKKKSTKGTKSTKSGKGTKPTAAPPPEKKMYQVEREPCVPADSHAAMALGVGRIPLASLADASVLFARGLVRQRETGAEPGRVLMIANSGIVRRPLPLCEVISRVTAQEFKNCRIPLDEFYGQLADAPEIMTAARRASLIIYEGHVSYQDLIYVAYSHLHVPDDFYDEAVDALENPPVKVDKPAAEEVVLPAFVPPPPPRQKPRRLVEPLDDMPAVVLQSCDSLDEQLMDRVDELGGVGVIGSVTPIHSGSGSMLVGALANAILYRGATLGEALRDAQNFLFCLGDLKIQRGMKEHAKSRRVALSFRLWGDPELFALPDVPGRPRGKPVSGRWTGPGELTIDVPTGRFPEAQSSRYSAQMLPGSQAAGLVKKVEGATRSMVLPSYYLRVPLPKGFDRSGAWKLDAASAPHAAFRLDALERYVYLVYLPEAEHPGTKLVLRWK